MVYILNRDGQARLTISSPLEAHKSNTLVYHMVGVDVGFENPLFACLEIDYEVSISWDLITMLLSSFKDLNGILVAISKNLIIVGPELKITL